MVRYLSLRYFYPLRTEPRFQAIDPKTCMRHIALTVVGGEGHTRTDTHHNLSEQSTNR